MSRSATKPRFILFGIDGATFDIIRLAVAEGKLPHIGRLMARGSHQVLKSVIPPVTAPAWTTIMTGVNPGKHGVFEFYTLKENSYNTRLVSSLDRKTLSIWEVLNQGGLSVGVLNVPMTYPPDPVQGWMISGMMGALEFGEATCLPPELAQMITALVGHYPMRAVNRTARGGGHYDFYALCQQIASRRLVTMELLRKYPVDVLILVCNYTDHVQHWFWRDRSYTTPEGEEIEDMILYAYQAADKLLGELLEFCGDQTTTFIVSDHGAGPIEEHLNIDRFLLEMGLATLKSGTTSTDRQRFTLLERIRNLTPQWLRQRLPPGWFERARSFFRQQKLSRIDWAQTLAFNIGTYPGLRLNIRGREPQGSIAGEDYEARRQEIRRLLEDYRHPHSGECLFEVFTRYELYHGPYVDAAPDLTAIVGNGAVHLAKFSHPARASVWIDPEEMNRVAPHSRTGSHRMEGVLIAAGPHIRAQAMDTEAQLVDIVPTMLYALDLPVPEYCDGQVLTDMFTSDFINSHPPQYTDISIQRELAGDESSVYSEQEGEQIAQRLRDLGYLD